MFKQIHSPAYCRSAASAAALAAGLCAASGAVQAQDPVAEFVTLWTEYIDVCGPALAAPENVLANREPRAGYDTHLFHSTPDQSAISLQHFGLNENHYTELALTRFGDVFTLYCDVSRYAEYAVYEGRVPEVAEQLRAVVSQSPGLAIAGGGFDLLPDSVLGPEVFSQDIEYHTTYVIQGAFPDFPQALSQLYVDPYGMYLVVATSWSVAP